MWGPRGPRVSHPSRTQLNRSCQPIASTYYSERSQRRLLATEHGTRQRCVTQGRVGNDFKVPATFRDVKFVIGPHDSFTNLNRLP